MFKPQFNKVLVEIDDKEAKWGSGNDESMLGASYREGKLLEIAEVLIPIDRTQRMSVDTLEDTFEILKKMMGKTIMWHEGTEAGTVFEENGKKYGLIYWFDIIGFKE